MAEWKELLLAELEKAEGARSKGNEGQARVCARRAAGIAAREYFRRQGKTIRTPNAYDLLTSLAREEGLPPGLRHAAVLLTIPVDGDFKLPGEVDLIAEAKFFCQKLLGITLP